MDSLSVDLHVSMLCDIYPFAITSTRWCVFRTRAMFMQSVEVVGEQVKVVMYSVTALANFDTTLSVNAR